MPSDCTRWKRAGLFAHPAVGERVDVDWVTGTCMAVDQVRFCALGDFDDAFFVYCKDVALGHRARQCGWRSRLREDVAVLHGTGSSSAPSSEMRRLKGASFTTYINRYGNGRLQTTTIRALYVLGFGWRFVVLAGGGRRESAAAASAIIRGVVTQRAFVGGTEVTGTRAREAGGRIG